VVGAFETGKKSNFLFQGFWLEKNLEGVIVTSPKVILQWLHYIPAKVNPLAKRRKRPGVDQVSI